MKNRSGIKVFYKLFFLAAIFFSVFVLLQMGEDFVAVGIAGVVILVAGYLQFSQNEKYRQEEKNQQQMELDRKLDELLNAQRAIYTITKRGNAKREGFASGNENLSVKEVLEQITSLQERMLDENRKLAEIQVNALKAVAKYNKENARQIVLNINKNADRISELLRDGTLQLQQEIKETTEAIEEAEEFYQNMSVDAASALEGEAEELTEPDPGEDVDSDATPELGEESSLETEMTMGAGSIPELGEESSLETEMALGAEPAQSPEPVPVEPPTQPSMPTTDDPNKMMSPEDIASLLASMGTTDQPSEEPQPAQTPPPSLDSIVIPEPEPISFTIPEPDPIQAPTLPKMDDPNKKMSPDDIAALIASIKPE